MHFLSYTPNVAHASVTIFGNIVGYRKGSTTDNVDPREENLLEQNATGLKVGFITGKHVKGFLLLVKPAT